MSNKPYVLYRATSLENTPELTAITDAGISLSDDVSKIPADSIVFPRFRSIPFGKELADSVAEQGSSLVNSWDEYRYISDLPAWVHALDDLTPAAYGIGVLDSLPEGEYFVKGETNSAKHDWLGSAYAPDLDSLHTVISNLKQHSVVGSQNLVIRPFVHYRQLAVMESQQPIFNEWRVFILNGKVMAKGFYWSKQQHLFAAETIQPLNQAAFDETLQTAISRVGRAVPFLVLDLAEKPDGSWQVIELNDGNMSGLCGVNPVELWANIAVHYSS